jgi:hypothetical protein
MVVVDHAGVRHTSRAAESGLPQVGEAHYHRACYERRVAPERHSRSACSDATAA